MVDFIALKEKLTEEYTKIPANIAYNLGVNFKEFLQGVATKENIFSSFTVETVEKDTFLDLAIVCVTLFVLPSGVNRFGLEAFLSGYFLEEKEYTEDLAKKIENAAITWLESMLANSLLTNEEKDMYTLQKSAVTTGIFTF